MCSINWTNCSTQKVINEALKSSHLTPNDDIITFYIEFVLYILKHTYMKVYDEVIISQNIQYIHINKLKTNNKTQLIKDILNELIRSGYFVDCHVIDILYDVMLQLHKSLGNNYIHVLEFTMLQSEVRTYINVMDEEMEEISNESIGDEWTH